MNIQKYFKPATSQKISLEYRYDLTSNRLIYVRPF